MRTEEIGKALRSGNALEKERAALLVQADPRLASKSTIEDLKQLLKDPSWHVRRAAALALISQLGKDARKLVEHLLQDRAYGVRQDVATALGELDRLK